MSTSIDMARARAEAQFKKKEQQARDGEQARDAAAGHTGEHRAAPSTSVGARRRSAEGIIHEEYGGISKRAARKKPCVEAGLKSDEAMPIDEQGITPPSLFRCDGDHKLRCRRRLWKS